MRRIRIGNSRNSQLDSHSHKSFRIHTTGFLNIIFWTLLPIAYFTNYLFEAGRVGTADNGLKGLELSCPR